MSKIQYHRQCRRRFTLKKELKKLKRKSEEREDGNLSSSGTAKRQKRKPSASRIYKIESIFCGKDKCLKVTSTRAHLTKVRHVIVDVKLRQCAIEKQDIKILAITSHDIVVAQAHLN